MRLLLPAMVTLLITIGCNGGPPPIQTAPVSGTATYQGKPLEDYRVSFFLPGARVQVPATGRVGADGKFTMGVRSEDDGAIVGLNQVWLKYDPDIPPVDVTGAFEPTPPPAPKIKIPEKYLSRDTSGITVEVPPDGLTDYQLELKSETEE